MKELMKSLLGAVSHTANLKKANSTKWKEHDNMYWAGMYALSKTFVLIITPYKRYNVDYKQLLKVIINNPAERCISQNWHLLNCVHYWDCLLLLSHDNNSSSYIRIAFPEPILSLLCYLIIVNGVVGSNNWWKRNKLLSRSKVAVENGQR